MKELERTEKKNWRIKNVIQIRTRRPKLGAPAEKIERKIMGHKILDVKADIHEDIEKYFVQLNDIGHDLGYTELGREVKTDDEIKEDVLNIIDKLWND